ncbi:MAG: hypothetical protein J6C09_04605 [Clostridia bacterium]|nr:hypothetical protein [Clostridia bacterium]
MQGHKANIGSYIPLIVFFSLSAFIIIFASAVTDAVSYGIRLSVLRVIPSLFPFFILSDYFVSTVNIPSDSLPSRLFGKIFGISSSGLVAFVIGAVGGFPLGVRCAAEEYRRGNLTKEELEGIVGIVNNPSPAFVIVSVGCLMLGDIGLGFILYLSMLLSVAIIGVLFRQKRHKSPFTSVISRQSFDLSRSIKEAGYSSLAISSYIIFFSAVVGALSAVIKSEAVLAFLSAFFEIGNATSRLAISPISYPLRIAMIGFALGFSGLSVHMQAFSLLDTEVRKGKYIIMKLSEGLLCAVLSFVIFSKFVL